MRFFVIMKIKSVTKTTESQNPINLKGCLENNLQLNVQKNFTIRMISRCLQRENFFQV